MGLAETEGGFLRPNIRCTMVFQAGAAIAARMTMP
jgi:hypothetical protein